jgi:hypothetical protein
MTAPARIALLTFVLAACQAPDSSSLAGRYIEHIEARDNPPWRDLIGDFEFDFRAGGELHVHQVGGSQVDAVARWRLNGDLLTISESGGATSCRESGLDLASALYRVTYIDGGIELRVLRDECRGRRDSIPLRPLRRVR